MADAVDLSTSSISKSEHYRQGDGMTGVRIRIIEEVTGEEIEGPFYRRKAA
jgi:hypothetical protein